MNIRRLFVLVAPLIAAAFVPGAAAVTFTNDATISILNTNYDGLDIVVSNCTLTINGPHVFSSLLMQSGGKLTHSSDGTGQTVDTVSVVNEPHALTDTNAVSLVNSNVVLTSVAVWDVGGTFLYTNNLDYILSADGSGYTQLARTTNSTIPDGTNVLVSYNWQAASVASGINLVVSNDVTVSTGAFIHAAGRGYSSVSGIGRGSSSGSPFSGGGGGNGGYGGTSLTNSVGGSPLGSYQPATTLGGAGGNGANGVGAPGGGLVQIQCGGTFTLDGTINVNGLNATNSRSGGGAGGSVWILTTNFTGAGVITANGGAGEPIYGGGGGGGRIAIEFATNTFIGSLSAVGGTGWQAGGAGTVFVGESGTVGKLTLDNAGRSGAGTLLSITSGSSLAVQGQALALFNSSATLGDLLVRSNSQISTYATNNATLTLTAHSNAVIEATAQLNLNGRGAFRGQGSGVGGNANSGTLGGGGGHGGFGGRFSFGITNANGGVAYDSVATPVQVGSGAGSTYQFSGWGGGVIRLIVSQNLFLDGELRADGTSGTAELASGGSGGSIWVTTGGIYGSGRMTADGGSGGMNVAGGGGGGRIAVHYTSNSFTGTYSARGGNAAYPGGAGTVYLKPAQSNGSLILDNGGLRGAYSTRDSTLLVNLAVANGAVLSNGLSSDTLDTLYVGTNATLLFSYFSITLNVNSNLIVAPGGLITVDGAGSSSSPPGTGGGGHAGMGGRGISSSGNTGILDSASSPTGSGGAGGYGSGSSGGRGGGLLAVSIPNGSFQLDGKLSANGLNAVGTNSGAGAGGSLRVTAGRFAGSGSLSADGGTGILNASGGGGGGCIAVTCTTTNNTFTGSFSAKGGNGYQSGGAGTVFYKRSVTNVYPSVTVDNGGVVGTNTVFSLSGFNAVDLTIQGGGIVSSWSGPSLLNLAIRSNSWFTANSGLLVLSNALIEVSGGIRLDGLGTSSSGAGDSARGGGGGHGGNGGGNSSNGGIAYDSIIVPSSPGSYGGHPNGFQLAAKGGGNMQFAVAGRLQLDGSISANGLSGDPGTGGGSGGALRLILNEFGGTGSVSANGGAGIPLAGLGGGGGGGRIAVTWNLDKQRPTNSFTGTFAARGGDGVVPGGAGTIYLKRNDQSFGTLIVDNGGLLGPTNTPLTASYSLPNVGWNLSVLGGALAALDSTVTSPSNIIISAGSQITLGVNQTSLPLTVLNNLTVESGAAINLNGRGYARAVGINSGAGGSIANQGAGGGYGGVGGASASQAKGGTNYGSAAQPVDRGSGGGIGANSYFGGSDGGGVLKLIVPGTLTLNGLLTASGNPGLQDDSGGGAGGSIWVMAKNLVGNGVIAADGGDGELYNGGGGGGGRIAVYAKTTNAFTGTLSALGGDGANAGQDGTIIFTTNMLPFTVVSATPTAVTRNTVGSVTFNFSQLIDSTTVNASVFTLTMPTNYGGPLPGIFPFATPGSSSAGATFLPVLNVPGDYSFTIAPSVTDIFGTPLSSAYTNTFTVIVPTVEGYVWTTNGLGVPGVTVQTSGYLPATTDANGYYALGVAPNWSGTIAPVLGTNLFLPGSIALANVTAQVTNQNFVMVPTLLPDVSSGVAGTNLQFNWTGFSSVTYQAYTSSNLVDWVPWGDPLPGTNAPMQLQIPIGTDRQSFFRLGAAN